MLDDKGEFIFSQLLNLGWQASVQRANLYCKDTSEKARGEFRERVFSYVRGTILEKYKMDVSEEEHISNISLIVDFANAAGKNILQKSGEKILQESGYKFGIAQKFLNLTLKYLWCWGKIKEPPHCPIDRIIINKTELKEKFNWTTMTSVGEYNMAINAIKKESSGMSIAQWELENYVPRV